LPGLSPPPWTPSRSCTHLRRVHKTGQGWWTVPRTLTRIVSSAWSRRDCTLQSPWITLSSHSLSLPFLPFGTRLLTDQRKDRLWTVTVCTGSPHSKFGSGHPLHQRISSLLEVPTGTNHGKRTGLPYELLGRDCIRFRASLATRIFKLAPRLVRGGDLSDLNLDPAVGDMSIDFSLTEEVKLKLVDSDNLVFVGFLHEFKWAPGHGPEEGIKMLEVSLLLSPPFPPLPLFPSFLFLSLSPSLPLHISPPPHLPAFH
jgi:hypothetical protein